MPTERSPYENQVIGITNTLQKAVYGLISNSLEMDQPFVLSDSDEAQIYMLNKDPPSQTQCRVDTLIHERCLSQPTAPAVCGWDGEFSYRELERLSSALAQHLVTLGVGPEVFVSVCFEKSRWNTVAMLAVTKAGGAFVLLDPSHPKARLLNICQSVSATVIVTLSECSKLAVNLGATVVEKLAPTDTAKWASHVRVVNLYGASECSIMSIQSTTGGSSPLYATDHMTGSCRWIVHPNDHERLLPVGVVGELLIEGLIVGRGYIDNPENTAATFIQPPDWLREFRGDGYCQKVYKSGDLAQYDANGSVRTHKTNRKLLRELVTKLSREELQKYQPQTRVNRAPLTTMEKLLQQYFARVLNLPVEHIGADDHFFRRGGDSLTAMKLVAMTRKDGYNLTVQDVFEHPHLSALACVIRCGAGNGDERLLPEPFSLVGKQRDMIRAAAQQYHLPVRAIEDIYPCTPLQRGFMSETLRGPKAFIADLALPLSPNINVQRLQEAWTAVANANPILRTRIILSPFHGLLQVVVRENIRWIVSDSEEPRNLAAGIGTHLLQLYLCYAQECNQNRPQLFLTIHHAVYDGWTLPLIFGEVEAAYHRKALLAWAITRAQHQETNDVFFGIVVSGRNAPVTNIESMTVPTVATIPCRVTLGLQSSVRITLHKVQSDTIKGIPFEQTGLSDIRRLWENTALACSFQTLLGVQPAITTRSYSWMEESETPMDYRADAIYAINVICGMEGDELKVTTLYDLNVVKGG
ncbi:hypothetical protein M434DRAFT_17479 [Hypoxylon sp. CO27-5]|nr:hypothetical protein M434DRAFT_17479 [Hypoxylon sp. CO27-5]